MNLQAFLSDIQGIIANAKDNAIRSVNFERVLMYWNIGRRIFEEKQAGEERAEYGSFLIKSFADALAPGYASGFSQTQLERCRQFYKIFPIANALRSQFI